MDETGACDLGAFDQFTCARLCHQCGHDGLCKFARVASRPEQAAFRRRVFLAHGGACVVTGCRIVEALDAAHRTGRDWRLGHNQATDGMLLRKDIHALYDSGLIAVGEDGSCKFGAVDIAAHYREFAVTSS
ncbi:MAG: HNH endonuclease [Comamonadaceae bacterium]|nr:MAG: HNH endonuclease [Comamonadaceae bacterium]